MIVFLRFKSLCKQIKSVDLIQHLQIVYSLGHTGVAPTPEGSCVFTNYTAKVF